MKLTVIFIVLMQPCWSLHINWGQAQAPHRTMLSFFGEDAAKVSQGGNRGVVVDGRGAGSGRFARELCAQIARYHHRNFHADALHALQNMAKDGLSGQATVACVDLRSPMGDAVRNTGMNVLLSWPCSVLDVSVLGDCQVAVFRRSPPKLGRQTLSQGDSAAANTSDEWIAVYKSGRPPARSPSSGKKLRHRSQAMAAITDKGIIEHPTFVRETRTSHVVVQSNDVVLLGSDGLFDNVTEEEMLAHVKSFVKIAAKENGSGGRKGWVLGGEGRLIRGLAKNLVRRARNNLPRHGDVPDITALAGFIRT